MEELHRSELEQLKQLFKERGLNQVPDRLTVVEGFFADDEHLTPKKLAQKLAAQGHPVGEELVVETLELLCRLGFAHRKEFAGGPQYEHRHLDEHHDHLICTECGRIVEFLAPEMERLQKDIARQHGFKLLEHRHQLYGLCHNCRAGRRAAMPLALAKPGERVRVADYLGGRRSQARLADMGLSPGTEVEILTADGGPMVLACRGSRLALGRNLARKLTCLPIENGKND